MHSLHYDNLPFSLRGYCEQPTHRYSTRYKTAGNYVMPCPTTNRAQRSIKFAGPKAWVEVPKQIKDIAFRKPFSKKFKEHVLSKIFEEMTPVTTQISENAEMEHLDLYTLFQSDEDTDEFLGFDLPNFPPQWNHCLHPPVLLPLPLWGQIFFFFFI